MGRERPSCSWCSEPAEGDLILRKRTPKKRERTAPACGHHIRHFNAQGVLTVEQAARARESR